MHLKALALHGFKSFADPTRLDFEPGVTAIVGPNGCGKSNVADSIRWVLGEQSAKALRGGKMQDVIFEGADTRKPAQLCEVALVLTDCEKQLGSEFHEIEIRRRVHRDGQSEYFFNGQPCRLKDIHKLFMDTGIGRTSYSVMAQGQIDQILSSKPEERRAVFEEAAGITRYKAQRREALQKLGLTDQNLARVADVIGEVGRQIGSLRRQASKALRFKKLSHRLRHLALAQAGHQWRQLSGTATQLDSEIGRLRELAETRRADLQQRQAELEDQRAARTRLTQRVQDAQQAVYDLRSQREQAENAANMAELQRHGLEERLAAARAQLGELEMQIRELSEQADSGAQDRQLQLELLGTSDADFQSRNRELSVLEGELSKREQELQQAKFQLLQIESAVARHRTDTTSFEVDQKTSAQRHDALAAEIEAVRVQHAEASQVVADLAERTEAAFTDKNRAASELTAAQQALTDATREFREAQRALSEIDRALAQRTARLKLLQQLQEKWEGYGEGAKAILQGRFAHVLGDAKPLPLTHGLLVKPAAARAIEALLGASAEAIGVADLDIARRILAELEAGKVGSVHLRVPVGENIQHPTSNIELPSFLRPATEGLDGHDNEHPAVALLGSSFIADELPAFLDFWRATPGFRFLAVATPAGDLVDGRGVIFGGSHRKPANSIVQREIDLRETARLVAEEQAKHDAQRTLIDGLTATLNAAEAAIEEHRAAVLAATQAVAAVQGEHRTAQRSLEEVATRLARQERDLAGLEQARIEAHARWERAQAGLAESEQRAADQRARITSLEEQIVTLRTDRDAHRDNLAQSRLELAERRQKVEVLDRGLTEMQRRRNQLEALLSQRLREIDTWTEQTSSLEQQTAAQRARAAELAETFVVAQEQVEKVRRELVEVERAISAVEGSQTSLRDEADRASADYNKCDVKLAETRARLGFLTDEVNHEFQADVSTLDWKALLWRSEDDPPDLKPLDLDDEDEDAEAGGQSPEAESSAAPVAAASGDPSDSSDPSATAAAAPKRRRKKKEPRPEPTEADLAALEQTNWTAVKTEVDALRSRIGSMGAVNLVAIEEYASLKDRYDFLKGQSDDLTASRDQLVKAIDEINATSMQQFTVTFEQIKKNFAYTFQTLFGGGVANLELVQSDDILESGIEITAQPPGTKLKGITLLSGGQKTLTAVALLFALYMVKPSPFCLLDELDAPLDESNIGRFTNLLRKFVHESQFIIITHNKRTIAAADAIYGVTMEERGVSKTVSMKFNQERGDVVAAPAHTTVADAVRQARAPAMTAAPAAVSRPPAPAPAVADAQPEVAAAPGAASVE